jgi:DNA-nicking Smr family endonuclease
VLTFFKPLNINNNRTLASTLPENMTNKFNTVSLDTIIDKHIGKIGTPRRDSFENKLRIDLLGQTVKQARQEPISM